MAQSRQKLSFLIVEEQCTYFIIHLRISLCTCSNILCHTLTSEVLELFDPMLHTKDSKQDYFTTLFDSTTDNDTFGLLDYVLLEQNLVQTTSQLSISFLQ